MSASLARRIRRIGLLPTTYVDVPEYVLVRDPKTGTEEERKITKRVAHRHHDTLTLEELQAIRDVEVSLWREKRKTRKAIEKKNRKTRVKISYVKKANPGK